MFINTKRYLKNKVNDSAHISVCVHFDDSKKIGGYSYRCSFNGSRIKKNGMVSGWATSKVDAEIKVIDYAAQAMLRRSDLGKAKRIVISASCQLKESDLMESIKELKMKMGSKNIGTILVFPKRISVSDCMDAKVWHERALSAYDKLNS